MEKQVTIIQRPNRILIVDDEQGVLDLCAEVLNVAGYSTVTTTLSEEAIQLVRSRDFDLVLTDLKMPGMDGIALMRTVEEINPSLGVVMMTAYGDMESAISAIQAGAFGFIIKPFEPNDLYSSIQSALDRIALRRENIRLRSLIHLMEVSEAITSTLDISELFKTALRSAAKETTATRGSIMLKDVERDELYIKESVGWNYEEAKKVRIKFGEGIAGQVFAEERYVVVQDIKSDPRFRRSTSRQYKTNSFLCVPMKTREKIIGVMNLSDKEDGELFTEADEEVVSIIATQAAIVFDNALLFQAEKERSVQLKAALEEIESTYEATLDALIFALDLRDTNTYGHSQRVAQYTKAIASKMGVSGAGLVDVVRGALLHDVGKIGVSDSILRKPDKLTDKEWAIIQGHPSLGWKMLSGIGFLKQACDIVLHHQEKYDGTGYPYGLSKEDISLGARIFAVADTLDAITSDRPYRKALSYEVAKAEITKYMGSQFDPSAVSTFLEIPDGEWEEIKRWVEAFVKEKMRTPSKQPTT